VTIGVLGLGSIGLRHASNLLESGQGVIAYDPSAARRARLDELGGEAVESRDGVLETADAIVVASPNVDHLRDLGDSLSAGRHVFAEKPLAHTDVGVEDLLAQAEAAGLVVFAGLNQRFNPAVRRAKALLDGAAIGTVLWARLLCASYLPDWRPDQDYRLGYAADPRTGGVLFDIIHEFDLANHLLGPGETVAAVARNTGTLELAADDCADVVLRHAGGVQSNLHLDYVTRPPRRAIEIAGTGGLMQIDVLGRRLSLVDTDGGAVEDHAWETSVAEDYRAEMDCFIDCVHGTATPPCDGREALSVLRQVLAARAMSGLPSP
jgi:predicted dehydrogenase